MKQIIGLAFLCAGFACAEYVSTPIMAHLPDEVNYTDGAYAYAPATVYYDGVFHQFYCSRGGFTDHFFYHPDDDKGKRVPTSEEKDVKLDKDGYRLEHGFIRSHDHIRYRTSKNGTTWSPARIVMTQTRYEYKNKQICTCDPAIIKGDDGYWYLYYQGAAGALSNGILYDGIVYVSRSKSIGGPYLTLTTNNKWERWPKNPKPLLQKKIPKGYGVGQLSVVKKGKNNYHFWFTDNPDDESKKMTIKHTISDSPTFIPNNNWMTLKIDGKLNLRTVDIGEVRWNHSSGHYEMWLLSKVNSDLSGEMWELTRDLHAKPWEPYNASKEAESRAIAKQYRNDYGQLIYKYTSYNGIEWKREGRDKYFGGRYFDISNLGVSGDSSGWIHDGRYILSFAAPSVGLYKIADDFYERDGKGNVFRCDSKGNKIESKKDEREVLDEEDKKEEQLPPCYNSFPWAMWQMIVGDWQTSSIKIPYGLTFPEEPKNYKNGNFTKNLEYITGDFDGDGVTDLAAVDKKEYKCYIQSSQTGQKGVQGIPWGATLKNMTANHTIVTGDYDGDGKTDIGVVDRAKGRWTVTSSRTGGLIWDNWPWDKMTSSHTVVSGDFDGDGKTDRAIVNTSEGTWWIISSRTGGALEPDNENHIKTPDGQKIWEWPFPYWKSGKSRILVGDYDNDGITDIGMVNVSAKLWYVFSSQTGKFQKSLATGEKYWETKWNSLSNLSQSSIITMGDYNGDGTADRGFVNWKEGKWYHEGLNPLKLMESLNGWNKMKKDMAKASHYKILEGDYDGDGATDHAFVNLDTREVYIYSSIRGTKGIDWDIKHVYSFPNKKYLAKNSTAEGDVDMDITPVSSAARISVNGSKLVIQDAKVGDKISIMDAQGRMVRNTVATGSEMDMHLPSSGMYIVRVGSKVHRISIK